MEIEIPNDFEIEAILKKLSSDDGQTLGVMHDSDDPIQIALVSIFENCTYAQLYQLFKVKWVRDLFKAALELSQEIEASPPTLGVSVGDGIGMGERIG